MAAPRITEFPCPAPGVLPCAPEAIADVVRAEGAVFLRGLESAGRVAALRAEAERLVAEDTARYGRGHRLEGVVYAVMTRSALMLEHMMRPAPLSLFRALLGHGCIVHHYCVSAMPPGQRNYAGEIHTDVPASRVIPGYVTNVGLLLALDPFTADNGAFELALRSFAEREVPDPERFERERIVALMDAGDAVLFNARCAHRGGLNRTSSWRYGLALQFCRPWMRQLFDYPRMMGLERVAELPEDVQQVLGAWVRMPAGMDEFLAPPEQRPYRPGQE